MKAETIIEFWFETIEPKSWWIKDHDFDLLLEQKFTQIHHQAINGELYHWRSSAYGRLAEIIILDQFSRNIYRNSAQAFAYDGMALLLAQEALAHNCQLQLQGKEKSFLYMPFMHSESVVIHEQALQLFNEPEVAGNLEFEKRHKAIIDRFGRYPHRNKILGRESTAEELLFLEKPGSSF